MSVTLKEILTLVGRLDDTSGFDTPRERFRRFITERVTDVAGVRALLAQCQEGLGDQHARARHDLVVMLGRFLGFEVTFGAYESRDGGARNEGHWRSRRHARIVVEVRSEQTADADVEALSGTVAALAAAAPPDLEERWVGLCVTTPFYAARRRLEMLLEQRETRDIRCVTVDSLLWLADAAAADRLTHADALRLLTSGPDSDFMIDLMRRFTEGTAASVAQAAAAVASMMPSRDSKPTSDGAPHLSIVADREREIRFWLSCLADDEAATPEQILDSVIRERCLLGITDAAPWPTQAQPGDWVCFLIAGTGIVGHAQLDGVVPDPSAVIRGARRFGVVFRLKSVTIYDVPNAVGMEPARGIVDRLPLNAAGTFLAPMSRGDYETLTAGMHGGARAAGS
jgi:hypothetical protein